MNMRASRIPKTRSSPSTFKRILVPVDLTRKSKPALEVALKLAIQNDALVTLLHVIERVDHITSKEMDVFYKKLEKKARHRMNTCAKLFHDEGMKVDQMITYGKRTREIVKFAMNKKIDLIVLSSHRVDPDEPRPNFGTISYAVGILSQCPVLLVK